MAKLRVGAIGVGGMGRGHLRSAQVHKGVTVCAVCDVSPAALDAVTDPGVRIDIYKRLATRQSEAEVEEIGTELADRFGPLPAEAEGLMGVMALRILARELGVAQVALSGSELACQITPESPISPQVALSLVERSGGRMRLIPPDRLLIRISADEGDMAIIAAAKNSLSDIAAYVSEKRSNP